jgi:uncharacterized repeat protein (TIGR03803 family)
MAGADGQYPSAGLILAGSKLYGTTQAGGTSGYGTVFEVSIAGQESILYSLRGGTDGAYPSGGLVLVGRNRPRFEVMLMPLTGPSAIDWVDKDSAKCSGCSARRPLVAQISGEPLWHYPTNFFPTFSFAVRESTDRCRIYE